MLLGSRSHWLCDISLQYVVPKSSEQQAPVGSLVVVVVVVVVVVGSTLSQWFAGYSSQGLSSGIPPSSIQSLRPKFKQNELPSGFLKQQPPAGSGVDVVVVVVVVVVVGAAVVVVVVGAAVVVVVVVVLVGQGLDAQVVLAYQVESGLARQSFSLTLSSQVLG